MADRTYTVKPGDSLYAIAVRYSGRIGYAGSPDLMWRDLWAQNRQTIGDNPHLIHPETVLAIPSDWPDHPDFVHRSFVDLRPYLQGSVHV